MLENIRDVITRLPMDRLERNFCGRIPSSSVLPWQRPLPSNGTLNILQLCASGGRMREPILMKFGMQQQVKTAVTVTGSNINFF